jgi:hypothetical protein
MRMSDKNMTGLWTDTWLSGATRCVGDVSQNKRARAKYPKVCPIFNTRAYFGLTPSFAALTPRALSSLSP